MEQVIAALVGAIGGLVTGVVAAVATLRAKGIDRIVEDRKLWVTAYDTKFLEQRLQEYRKLWRLTKQTSRRKVHKLDAASASTLADLLTDWYYDDGGILLSEDARDSFFAARKSLELPGSDSRHTEIVERFSRLRTALCEDMNARRGPTLRQSESKDA